jgi:hypothetical protein
LDDSGAGSPHYRPALRKPLERFAELWRPCFGQREAQMDFAAGSIMHPTDFSDQNMDIQS